MKSAFKHIPVLLFTAIPLAAVGQEITGDSRFYSDSLYQHIAVEHRASLSCDFTYSQGSAEIIPSLNRNDIELARLDSFIRFGVNHPELYVSRIRLTGYSSIEGSYFTNEQLSRSRVESFYRYLRKHYPILSSFPNDVAWVVEDWNGLSKLVRSSRFNEWEEVLEIIRKVPDFDERERLIMYLNGGRAYSYIEHAFLPQLRRVEMEVEYGRVPYSDTNLEATLKEMLSLTPDSPNSPNSLTPALSQGEGEAENEGVKVQQQPAETPQPVVPTSLSFGEGRGEATYRFALKTNALLWAGVQHNFKHTTPVANVALEYYVDKNWSIEVGAMYSYWRFNSNQEFQGISGYRLEPRFSYPVVRDKFDAYLGLYFRFGDYDRQNGVESGKLKVESDPAGDYPAGDNSAQPTSAQSTSAQPTFNFQLSTFNSSPCGSTGDYWDAGLSAGVTLHLIGGLGLEVGARAGYVHTNAIRYTEDGRYNWYHSRKTYNKFKVTDLNVSLIYRFR